MRTGFRLPAACIAAAMIPLVAMPSAQGAQDETARQDKRAAASRDSDTAWVDITTWRNAYRTEEGWSADELLDEEAYGRRGEIVGEVEDFIIGPDGRIQHVVVEGGGFLDIGDSHIAVPWQEVGRLGTASITVPVTRDNLGEYGLFADAETQAEKPKSFRLRELLGDRVWANGTGYGTVQDVIFDRDGRIEAVVVDPAYGYGFPRGPIALPYQGEGYDPYQPYYRVPYDVDELRTLPPFDYGQLG